MGRSDMEAQSTLRFGMGRFTVQSEVDYVADRLVGLVERLRVGVSDNGEHEYTEKTVAI